MEVGCFAARLEAPTVPIADPSLRRLILIKILNGTRFLSGWDSNWGARVQPQCRAVVSIQPSAVGLP